MIVSKKHFIPELDDKGILHAKLRTIAGKIFGVRFVQFRKEARKIKNHFHWHIILEN